MKQFLKLFACIMLILCMALTIVACSDQPDNGGSGNNGGNNGGSGTGSGGGNGGDIILENIYTRNIKFNNGEIPYDGSNHTWEHYTGKTDPERVDTRFEYWKDGVKVADGGVGVSEAGVYEVRLYFFADGYKETYVTATLTIVSSYNISYAVGDGLTLPEGTTVADILGKDSPTIYADNTKNMYLIDAHLQDYKFKGWYLDEACTQAISIINGADMGSKDITLYAKFQPYLPYPQPFDPMDPVLEAPTVLPAIPGYDKLTEGAAPVLDMSIIYKENEDTSLGQKYQTYATDDYYFTFNDHELTAGGQPVIQWLDYNDTYEGNWPVDGKAVFHAGDEILNSSINFYSPLRTEYTKYDTVEFWVYCANNTVTEAKPEGDNIALIMWTDSNDGKTLRYSIPLNFSGWKKFTIRLRDFRALNTNNLNITRVSFYSREAFGEKATLSTNKDPNFIYLSNMYLTSYDSTYSTTGSIPKGESIKVLENIQDLVFDSGLDATQIEAYISQVASAGEGCVFGNTAIETYADLANTYETIWKMAVEWNTLSSSLYQNANLLSAIGAAMNKASAIANDFLDKGVALNDDITEYCLYAVRTALIIGDHVNATHGEIWMHSVLFYFPSSIGAGELALNSSFIYTGAHLVLGNDNGAISGIYQMTHLLSSREITLNLNSANVTDLMTVIYATKGTSLHPLGNEFMDDIFAWFYECVDALTFGGKASAEMDGNLVDYIRAMFLIYDLAPTATQNKFAGTIKYYLAKDSELEATLTANQLYAVEATVLNAIKASEVTAPTGESASSINPVLGQAIFKTDDFFFLLTKDGQMILEGTTIEGFTPSAFTVFEGLATADKLAILVDDKQLLIDATGIKVYDAQGYIADDEQELIIIGTSDINKNMGNIDGIVFYETDTALILLIEKTEDTYTVTINNYTGKEGVVTIYIDGDLEPATSELNVNFQYNSSDQNTRLTVDFTRIDGEEYTFTLTVYA